MWMNRNLGLALGQRAEDSTALALIGTTLPVSDYARGRVTHYDTTSAGTLLVGIVFQIRTR